MALTNDLYRTRVSKVFHPRPHQLLHSSPRVEHLTYCDCFGLCYILPNQKVFRQLIFHYLQNVFAGHIWPAVRSLETPDSEERAQRIEVYDDEHSLFMALRIGYCYV